MSKKIIISLLVVAVFVGTFLWRHKDQAQAVQLNLYNGTALVTRDGARNFTKTSYKLKQADEIKVESESRASIILPDGSVIRLDSNTQAKIEKLELQNGKLKNVVIALNNGQVWSNIMLLEKGADYEVETPTITAAVRGTIFNVLYKAPLNSVSVIKDAVSVSLTKNSPADNFKTVSAGSVFKISDEKQDQDFQAGPKAELEENQWVKFNIEEDKKIETKIEPKETPRPIQSFEAQPTPSPTPTPVSSSSKQNQKVEPTQIIITSISPSPTPSPAPSFTISPISSLTPSPSLSPTPSIATSLASSPVLTPSPTPSPTLTPKFTKELNNIRLSYQKIASQKAGAYSLPQVQMTAVGYYSDNSTQDITSQANWSISGNAGGNIDPSGLYAPSNQGTETITASFSNKEQAVSVNIP